MIPHRLVEVDRRARWSVEAGHPHRADEYNPERIVRILELGCQIFAHHAQAVWPDVRAILLDIFNLVLSLRYHDRHICHGGVGIRGGRFLVGLDVLPPVFLNFVVHADGGRFVDADDHCLAGKAAGEEMVDDVFGDSLKAVVRGYEDVLAGELALELAFLFRV